MLCLRCLGTKTYEREVCSDETEIRVLGVLRCVNCGERVYLGDELESEEDPKGAGPPESFEGAREYLILRKKGERR